jgi:predicted O-linked N-acetylglucosamine transferase (SPINDLY family)
MTTPAELFALALGHHQAGDLPRAEGLYRQILQADPAHADAWHLLGVLCSQHGEPEWALEYIGIALVHRPAAPFHLNRGIAFQALGRRQEALDHFRQALQLRPDFPEAHNNLANALYELGQSEQALAHGQEALRLRPDYAEAHHNLGQALYRQGKPDEALTHCQEAVRLQPHSLQAYRTRGLTFAARQQHAAAEECFRHVLGHQTDSADDLCSLGHVLQQQGKLTEAATALQEAIRLQPGLALAHNCLGVVRSRQGRFEEAVPLFEQALRLQPDNAEAFNNLGAVLLERRQLAEAAERFRQALRLRPDFAEAAANLGDALTRLGRIDEGLAFYGQALRVRPDDASVHSRIGEAVAQLGQLVGAQDCLREALRLQPDLATAHSTLLNLLNCDPEVDTAALFAEHRRWADLHARVPRLGPAPGHDRNPERRLRVGYLSPDLRRHVLVHFLEPLLAYHDPGQVEVVCFADILAPDAMTGRLRALAHGWHPVCGLTDAEVAHLVRDQRVDVLVDLAGHSGHRLGVFARRPAPVQLTYLGYPNTTGLDTMHYRLTDAVADPEGELVCHTETLVRLPGGFCCYAPPEPAPEVTPLPARSAGFVTFGSTHKLARLNGAVLRAVPAARLLVFRDALRGNARLHFREQFARRGIPPERILLRHTLEPGHPLLAVYGSIDVSLDTFPWSGHGTACESLWMGVPVLTLRGGRHAGRMVASVLTQIGLEDLVAPTPEEFVGRAVQLAHDPDRIAELRSTLRERMRASPLCDGRAFTRHLEEAYRTVWRRWAGGVDAAVGRPGAGTRDVPFEAP